MLTVFLLHLLLVAMAWMPCCCCEIFTDHFNRADSDDVGPYTEVAGDWDILSNHLEAASSDALLIADAEHPGGAPNVKVTVSVTIGASGDTARVILDYLDASNYWFAEVKAGTGAYLRIYERAAGVNTQRATKNISLSVGTFSVCVSITEASVFSVGVGFDLLSYQDTFSEPKFGLGTGTITHSQVEFDDLIVKKVELPDCPPCTIACPNCPVDAAAVTYWADVTFSVCPQLDGLYRLFPETACCWVLEIGDVIYRLQFYVVTTPSVAYKVAFNVIEDAFPAAGAQYNLFAVRNPAVCNWTEGAPLTLDKTNLAPSGETSHFLCGFGTQSDTCLVGGGGAGTVTVNVWSG